MKFAQINSVSGSGSTGRIIKAIEQKLVERDHTVLTAYGRGQSAAPSDMRIGGVTDVAAHAAKSYLDDGHGLGSRTATRRFVAQLERWQPDLIALHNIHGYFLHYPTLFEYLKRCARPVVWTLHDCWPFTGHCSYFDRFNCTKWQEHCDECPMTSYYPASLVDRSKRNFGLKMSAFGGLENLTFVTPSRWLQGLLKQSFLSDYAVETIHNGVAIDQFKPADEIEAETILLGVASVWSERKGLADFERLRELVPKSYRIVLIGVSKSQLRQLPAGIDGIERTESIGDLVRWYSRASVFVNPTYSDNFPTTNIEALACGTPVVTYRTGGSPEALDAATGRIVEAGDVQGLATAIGELLQQDRAGLRDQCRKRAAECFDKEQQNALYADLVERLASA